MPQDCRLVLFQVTSLWRHGPHPSTTTPFGVEKNGGEILTSGTSISLATTGYARKPHQTRKRAWSKLLRIWVATVNHIYCTHHLYNHPVCRHTWNAPQEEEHNILACKIKHAALGPNPWDVGTNQDLSISHLRPKAPRSIRVQDEAVVLSNKKDHGTSQIESSGSLTTSRLQNIWTGSTEGLEFSSKALQFSQGRGFDQGNPGIQSPLVHLLQWTKKDMSNNWLED